MRRQFRVRAASASRALKLVSSDFKDQMLYPQMCAAQLNHRALRFAFSAETHLFLLLLVIRNSRVFVPALAARAASGRSALGRRNHRRCRARVSARQVAAQAHVICRDRDRASCFARACIAFKVPVSRVRVGVSCNSRVARSRGEKCAFATPEWSLCTGSISQNLRIHDQSALMNLRCEVEFSAAEAAGSSPACVRLCMVK